MNEYSIENGDLYWRDECLPVSRSVILLTLIHHVRKTGEVIPLFGRIPISQELAGTILRHERVSAARGIATQLEAHCELG